MSEVRYAQILVLSNSQPPVQYSYLLDHKTCHKQPLTDKFGPLFSWLPYSTLAGPVVVCSTIVSHVNELSIPYVRHNLPLRPAF